MRGADAKDRVEGQRRGHAEHEARADRHQQVVGQVGVHARDLAVGQRDQQGDADGQRAPGIEQALGDDRHARHQDVGGGVEQHGAEHAARHRDDQRRRAGREAEQDPANPGRGGNAARGDAGRRGQPDAGGIAVHPDHTQRAGDEIGEPIGQHAALHGVEIGALPGGIVGALAGDHIAHHAHRRGKGADHEARQIDQRQRRGGKRPGDHGQVNRGGGAVGQQTAQQQQQMRQAARAQADQHGDGANPGAAPDRRADGDQQGDDARRQVARAAGADVIDAEHQAQRQQAQDDPQHRDHQPDHLGRQEDADALDDARQHDGGDTGDHGQPGHRAEPAGMRRGDRGRQEDRGIDRGQQEARADPPAPPALQQGADAQRDHREAEVVRGGPFVDAGGFGHQQREDECHGAEADMLERRGQQDAQRRP